MSKLYTSKDSLEEKKKHLKKLSEIPDMDQDTLEKYSENLFNTDYENDPEWQRLNLEYDLRTCDWIVKKVKEDDHYAQNLYAAMCNTFFRKNEVMPMLQNQEWSCSWRYAGGIIAHLREEGDYLDWYCSGIRNDGYQDDMDIPFPKGYVGEGVITDEIRDDLFKLGWLAFEHTGR